MSETEIVQMLINGHKDLEWFNENFERLKSKYNNMFIAFSNQDVIESDQNLQNLMGKLNKKKIDISNVFIEFVSDIKFIL